ncbi:helix-turn-helix domain-containing protein [Sphingomonas sp. BIUV-7]|uniref:Helix-turn-helix domain-containing protein n=1 Tax=Sphingomonas natans TaxID=3063330 RepID=A0ABT8Y8C6_9SPHN|nr:helix-turn-helix domain-containing protein [Sphingomonas sp. BIUV-7]
MPKRWYDDACGTALALELVGERWSLLIVRELMYGPRRFGEIKAALPGISANVLTQRLESLEEAAILLRRKLPPPANVQVYDLTAWGCESEPAIMALGKWATRSPLHDPTSYMSGASLMMSMRTLLVPGRMGDLAFTLGLRLGADHFTATIGGEDIVVARGMAEAPDVTIEAETAFPILAVLYGKLPPEAIEAEGGLRIGGERDLAARFAGLFELPAKIA